MKHVWSRSFANFLSSMQCQIRRYTRVRTIEVSHRFHCFSPEYDLFKKSTTGNDYQWPWFCSKKTAFWQTDAENGSKCALCPPWLRAWARRSFELKWLKWPRPICELEGPAAGYFDELALAVFDALALVEQKQCKFGRMLLPHTDWMLRTVACRPPWALEGKTSFLKILREEARGKRPADVEVCIIQEVCSEPIHPSPDFQQLLWLLHSQQHHLHWELCSTAFPMVEDIWWAFGLAFVTGHLRNLTLGRCISMVFSSALAICFASLNAWTTREKLCPEYDKLPDVEWMERPPRERHSMLRLRPCFFSAWEVQVLNFSSSDQTRP